MAAKKKVSMTLDEFKENELRFLADVIHFGSIQQSSVYTDTTAVKSPEVAFRGLVFSRNHLASEEYLLNYRGAVTDMGLMSGVNNFMSPVAVTAVAATRVQPNDDKAIPLPKYDALRTPLGAAIRSRRSVRHYSGKKMTLEELSTLLFYAQGETGTMRVNIPDSVTLGDVNEMGLRAAPSGGGLFPIHLYFLALNVAGLDPGIYRYVPPRAGIVREGPLPAGLQLGTLGEYGEMQTDKASLLFIYVYRLFENSRKYGDLGLAFAFMEIGATLQNIHLTCTSLGIGSCDVGGIKKRACERLIGVDGLSDHVMHLTLVGK